MFGLTPYERRNHDVPVVFNPFRHLEEIERNFWGQGSLMEFRTDIKDNGDSYLLEADLPGFKQEDIKIEVDDHYLTIRAERHCESGEKNQQGNYLRCERSYGSYARSFDISGVKEEEISAEYKDGVLRLKLPKEAKQKPEPRRLTIS